MEPGSIYLNRGNHENAELNERLKKHGGGFAEEARGLTLTLTLTLSLIHI